MIRNSDYQYRFLLAELVKKGIKLKYRRSYLGIIWSLIEPVLTTVVLVIVFGTIFENKNPTYPLYIITGRLIYSGFSTGTKSASKSIRTNASMIKKNICAPIFISSFQCGIQLCYFYDFPINAIWSGSLL